MIRLSADGSLGGVLFIPQLKPAHHLGVYLVDRYQTNLQGHGFVDSGRGQPHTGPVLLLDPPEMHSRSGAVEFGKDGKPFYIAGPHDNPDAVMRQLMRTVGVGHFNYLMPLGEPREEFDDFEVMDVDNE